MQSSDLARIVLTFSTVALIAGLQFSGKAEAFCENRSDGSRCHPDIVREALPFLRPEVLNAITGAVNSPDESDFLGINLDYASDDHFDNCNFDGGTELINDRYLSPFTGLAVTLSPLRRTVGTTRYDYPLVFEGVRHWARILHAAQDFYSHSNWVELGFTRPGEVIDRRLGPWRELPSNWGTVRDDIVAAQDDLPSGWHIAFPGSPRIPVVTDSAGRRFRLLISGVSSAPPWNNCPTGARISHDATLNKDNVSRPFHLQAVKMAVAQTQHEWCRLLNLAYAKNGPPGAAVLMGLLIKPGVNGHPSGTACAMSAPGGLEFIVRATKIRVLNDHEEEDSGQLNFVVTLFTHRFDRSVRTQTAPVRVNSGAFVPRSALPELVRICVGPNDHVVATLQAWEDDGTTARGELSNSDDLLSGVTRTLGRAIDYSSWLGRPVSQRSDNSATQELEVTFEISAGISATCRQEVFQ